MVSSASSVTWAPSERRPLRPRGQDIPPVVFDAHEEDALDKRLTREAREAKPALPKLLHDREQAEIAAAA